MKFLWLKVFIVNAILIKDNFCTPAIRPLSQRGIIFPVENWDDCFLDEAKTQPGLCKKLEECPDILKKWDKENIFPKTCYFIKKQQFVCCPIPPPKEVLTSTENVNDIIDKINAVFTEKPGITLLDIFNTDPGVITLKPDNKVTKAATTQRPSNIFLDKVKDKTTSTTKRPSNIFLDQVQNKTSTNKPANIFLNTTTTTTRKPSNIFLDNIKNKTFTTETILNISPDDLKSQNTTSLKPPYDIFKTEKPTFMKRRSEAECDMQNPQKFLYTDNNGPPTEPYEFPFMAVLGWKSEIDNKVWYPCGGILIAPKFVLTAAHCSDIGGVTPSFVHLGDKDLPDSEEGTIKIKHFIIHPSYNTTANYNDIALVELEKEVSNPMACLWTQPSLPIAKLIALGYGRVSFETLSSNQLFKASLTYIDNSECQELYNFEENLKQINILGSHLCAGDVENFRHFCQGDTGGPLVVEVENVIYVVGVTAFGLGCADLPPSIFTRISSFIDWIEPLVWPQIDVRIDN